ncbi:hypothetical protein HPP92_019527 [Vanilla planifolia]|uniref:HTH myb-type domain-containing protein n=1 Tax=Vanilla planifolia TaxID=51239 RepID=A0A835QAG7_VANPL|nr:hypothetical protein HPP92_019975 [Vanilla planifolia]KAG0465363.1 hypothetical protein HPP92_019527 [Vanilla planifolia]
MADLKRPLRDLVEALEEERRKIQMFSRELPLCLQLVTEAIEKSRRQMVSEEAFSESPVLEEFIPLRPTSSSGSDVSFRDKGKADYKPDWLRSVQLWGPAVPDDSPEAGSTLRKPVALKARKVGGAFQPFEREKLAPVFPRPYLEAAVSSNITMAMEGKEGMGGVEEKANNKVEEGFEGQSLSPRQPNRKQRRCWSPDLHRNFLHALDHLGGPQVATPKQIRELMKVDGLTNDEVKSHLQKYRLHTRRPSATVPSSNHQNQAGLVVVGGVWVPSPEYTIAAAAAATAAAQSSEGGGAALNGICSTVASLPLELRLQEDQQNQEQQQLNKLLPLPFCSSQNCHQNNGTSIADEDNKSNSCSTSFSSETTTASPPS